MKRLCLLGLIALSVACPVLAESRLDDKPSFIEQLLRQMTLQEKIGQLRLISIGADMPKERLAEELAAGNVGGTFNSVTRQDNRPLQDAALRSRLKIPIFFAYDVIHGHRTIFPIGLGLASSWDMQAVATAGRVAAIEASADGLDMTFAPMVDIARDPRWGRTSEGFGEDPYLVSEIARTMVGAYQGKSLRNPDSLMASVKHFALYGAVEGGRDYNVVDMSPLRMHQDYLPPYHAAIEAGAGGVMVALNTINGVPASANRWLLRDLLRKDWGFSGVTISDHGAITELLRHGVAADGREAAKLAIDAGLDMSMADSLYGQHLAELVQAGDVPMQVVDQAVREVLGAKYDLGLFHDPYRRIGKANEDPPEVNAESRLHRQAARDVARQSLVLLENRNSVLPLDKADRIALVGPLADSHIDMLGSWSAAGVAKQTVTLRQAMQAALGDHGRLVYARGANVTDDEKLVEYLNFLNWDSQQALLRALKQTGKPLVLVLMNGRPLNLAWAQANADAMLETWFSGTEGGHAIAEVLFGDYNPSGKLPISFPRSVGQIPVYYNHPRLGRPFVEDKPGNYTSQYFDEPNGPLYPFGYGLSYTQFSLSPPRLSTDVLSHGQSLEVSVTLKNTGKRDGATVVQLYIHDLAASVVRPVKELKGFRKVWLKAGEEQQVRFSVGEDELKFVDAQLRQVAEPGVFEVQVGLDSQHVQTQRFELR